MWGILLLVGTAVISIVPGLVVLAVAWQYARRVPSSAATRLVWSQAGLLGLNVFTHAWAALTPFLFLRGSSPDAGVRTMGLAIQIEGAFVIVAGLGLGLVWALSLRTILLAAAQRHETADHVMDMGPA